MARLGRGTPIPAAIGPSARDAIVNQPNTYWYNTFEGGTASTAITTGNSGGVSGNAWSSVSSTGATVEYNSSTRASNSALCAHILLTNATNTVTLQWTNTPPATGVQYSRWYIKPVTLSSGTFDFRYMSPGTGATGCWVKINASNKVVIYDSSNTLRATSSTTLTFGNWYRVEVKIVSHPAAGSVTVRIFDQPDGFSPLEEFAATSISTATAGGVGSFIAQFPGNSALNNEVYVDDIALGLNGWIGPVSPSPIPGFAQSKRRTYRRGAMVPGGDFFEVPASTVVATAPSFPPQLSQPTGDGSRRLPAYRHRGTFWNFIQAQQNPTFLFPYIRTERKNRLHLPFRRGVVFYAVPQPTVGNTPWIPPTKSRATKPLPFRRGSVFFDVKAPVVGNTSWVPPTKSRASKPLPFRRGQFFYAPLLRVGSTPWLPPTLSRRAPSLPWRRGKFCQFNLPQVNPPFPANPFIAAKHRVNMPFRRGDVFFNVPAPTVGNTPWVPPTKSRASKPVPFRRGEFFFTPVPPPATGTGPWIPPIKSRATKPLPFRRGEVFFGPYSPVVGNTPWVPPTKSRAAKPLPFRRGQFYPIGWPQRNPVFVVPFIRAERRVELPFRRGQFVVFPWPQAAATQPPPYVPYLAHTRIRYGFVPRHGKFAETVRPQVNPPTMPATIRPTRVRVGTVRRGQFEGIPAQRPVPTRILSRRPVASQPRRGRWAIGAPQQSVPPARLSSRRPGGLRPARGRFFGGVFAQVNTGVGGVWRPDVRVSRRPNPLWFRLRRGQEWRQALVGLAPTFAPIGAMTSTTALTGMLTASDAGGVAYPSTRGLGASTATSGGLGSQSSTTEAEGIA